MKNGLVMALFGLGFSFTVLAADPELDANASQGAYLEQAAQRLGSLEYDESPEPVPVPAGSSLYRGDGPVPEPVSADYAYGVIDAWDLDPSSA